MKIFKIIHIWLGVIFLLNLQSAWALSKCFYIDDHSGRDVVKFTSDAPVELIAGTTNKIKGKVCYDNSFAFDQKHPFDIQFEVDLASIDTGIPLRNEHMRDNFLETSKFPKAAFKVTKIKTGSKPSLKRQETVTIHSTGTLSIHGKTTQKKIPLKVTYFPESAITHHRFKKGNMIRIQGTFPVVLEEHAIKRPEMLFQKLAETVFVTIDVFGSDESDALK